MKRRFLSHTPSVVGFVAFALSFQPLSTDLYLPSLPAITQELVLGVSSSQWTLLALLLGFALSQLVWGPVSDRIGRRRVLLAGAGMYALSALACALSASGLILIAARATMGCGLAAMVVCVRALVRDLYDTQEGQQVFARALTGMAIAATLSGVAGGLLAKWADWRFTLGLLGVLALILWCLTWRHVDDEGAAKTKAVADEVTNPRRPWWGILRHAEFRLNTGLAAFTYAEAILFIGGSSLVLVRHLGVSPGMVGLLMTIYSGCFLSGTLLCRHVLRKAGRPQALRLASLLSGTACVGFALLALTGGWQHVLLLMVVQMTYMLGHGFNQVCSQSGAVAPFPENAGTAAALSGTLMIMCSVLLGQLQSLALSHTPVSLPAFAAFNAGVAGLLAWRLRHRW